LKKGFIVTIDGPAGAGKSTVSQQLAEVLGGVLLDTGAMYRGVAYFALKKEAKTAREYGVIARALKFDVDVQTQAVLVNGIFLGSKIRSAKVSDMASLVGRYKAVRHILTSRQRSLGRALSVRLPVVIEGRDIGSVVFPKAEFKFFVTASPQVRAERRWTQLKKQGVKGLTLKEVLRQQQARDRQDSQRALAPLRCPPDAVVVDTSSMGISQVVHFMNDHIQGHLSLT